MVDVDPSWINVSAGSPEYTAAELRRNESVLLFGGVADRLGARQGVRPGVAAVSLAGTTVTVHDVPVVVYPGTSSISGPYRAALLQTELALNPPDGTNPRKDIIVCQVQDHDEDSSGQRRARPVYVPGTPAASPAEPALPAGSFRLATVTVPASGFGAATLAFNAPWAVSSGGVLPVRDATELPTAGLYEGMCCYQQDIDALVVWSGTTWRSTASSKVPTRQVLTGNGTWTHPAGLKYVIVRGCAGGGGSGGVPATTATQAAQSSGGGGGGYFEKLILASDLAATVAVTVGAGGTAGATGSNAGGTGGSTSFGSHASATGGEGGLGGIATSTNEDLRGSLGGAATGGDINVEGGSGGMGLVRVAGTASGLLFGDNFGGGSVLAGQVRGFARNSAAADGQNYGGGARGASNQISQTAKAGAAGAAGVVLVTNYFA